MREGALNTTKCAHLGTFCRVRWSRGLEKVPNTKNVPRQVHFLCSAQAEAVVGVSKGVGVVIWVHWWLHVSK